MRGEPLSPMKRTVYSVEEDTWVFMQITSLKINISDGL